MEKKRFGSASLGERKSASPVPAQPADNSLLLQLTIKSCRGQSEIRISKSETSPKHEIRNPTNPTGVPDIEASGLEFVSDFEFRISNFQERSCHASAYLHADGCFCRERPLRNPPGIRPPLFQSPEPLLSGNGF